MQIQQPYPKQIDFFKAKGKYIAYGGARGGGKSWAARVKAALLAANYPGIQILLMRRTYPELYENHILPLIPLLKDIATYKEKEKAFVFINGSRIKLGYCDSERDVLQYQGQAYDVIILEEATQFTEFQFQTITESNRSSGSCKKKFSPRMYFTCNPGGVGHAWVKRLFIDCKYQNKERPEDYVFIKSLVYENKYLMENDPDYIRVLENLPDDRRRAMLYGDWDVFEGQYFSEFNRDIHVIEPFPVPEDWRVYRVMDYGLDMCAVYDIAVDWDKNAYAMRELYQKDLPISVAAEKMREMWTDKDGKEIEPYLTLAPPDLWHRTQESGKSKADLFADNNVLLTKVSNDREAGWLALKEWLKPIDDNGTTVAKLRIFANCTNLIRCIPQLQYDDKKPSDVATEPHEITHAPDAIRCFAIYWTHPPELPRAKGVKWAEDLIEDYFNCRTEEQRQYLIDKYGEPSNLYGG